MAIVEEGSQAIKPNLVQSQLTSAFFSSLKRDATTSTSPYFAKPPPSSTAPATDDPDDQAPTINLYPERRAYLHSFPSPASPSSIPSTHSKSLSLIALETKSLLPALLKKTPHAPPDGTLYDPSALLPLTLFPHRCPNLPPSLIRVINADSLDTALGLPTSTIDHKPVLVLNMANAEHGGGGWLRGALAQEEAMCYRSSLSFTLKRRFYPMKDEEGIYSPSVVIFRENIADGHRLLDLSQPDKLEVVSVVSVAAIRDPETVFKENGEEVYNRWKDKLLMKKKMRVCLRIAAREAHRRLVLGALGCGAFGNPRGEVVKCWKEVLGESEWEGWWESVMFAVLEDGGTEDGEGNFGVFWRGLDGVVVG